MSEVKHWTITTGLERRFIGTEAEAKQLQQEERDYYDSLTDGGEVCAYVVGSSLDCDGVLTDDDYHSRECNIQIDHALRCSCGHDDNLAQFGDHPLASGGAK